ncbi:DUF4199 domain-containing protein [Tenacibaculum sp. 190524A02b]|uniref:DUF4199 domain-containing protein n=1 Tax=Tenacibaculum vairaonense TaxID=3137860 RepID=A0ABM9PP47_9FLAO
MENQTNNKSIILNYGLILGFISILPGIVKYAIGGDFLEEDMVTGSIGIIASIALVVLAIKKCKSNNNGFLSWGEGLKIGMGVVVISMIISLCYLLIFTNLIEPNFKQLAIEKTEQQWIESGMSDEQIEISRDMVSKYFNLSLFGSIVIMSLFFGFIISAISSAIMKKTEETDF